MKTRILYEDKDGRGSTTAKVVWGQNRLLQRRQFATDGVRFFYQPITRSPFIVVSETEVPESVRKSLELQA